MTTAVIVSIPKVMGSKMAIPADGPRPGNMPTIIPTIDPMSRNSRFVGVAAMESPIQRSEKSSTSGPPRGCGEGVAARGAHGNGTMPDGSEALSQVSNSR